MIAEIVVGLPIDKTFHYSVPARLEDKICAGKRVWVPFGPRRLVGYVVNLRTTSGVAEVKDVEDLIDERPVLDEAMLKLSRWISEYYFCSWGEAIENCLPLTIRKGRTGVSPRKIPPERIYEKSFELKLNTQQRDALAGVLLGGVIAALH